MFAHRFAGIDLMACNPNVQLTAPSDPPGA